MRHIALILSVFMIASLPLSSAQAGSKNLLDWLFTPKMEPDNREYLMDGKLPHNSQWTAKWNPEHDWSPEKWIRAEGSAEAVMENFYRAGIIREQDEDGDIPVLVVGDAYMNLSGQEKRRVAEFVDYAFGVTERPVNPFFYIYYDRTDSWFSRGDPIGVYTAGGLQLQ